MTPLTRRGFLQGSAALSILGSLDESTLLKAEPAAQGEVRFGVNYIPRKNWLYSWIDWDQRAVREDLEAIAGLGMDHVRIHCQWPMFQPGINYVSDEILERLHALLDAADSAGLDVEITVLNGWMSGIAFMPGWVQPCTQDRNMFTRPEIIAGEKLLFRKIAAAVGAQKRFLGFDLGNELGVLQGEDNRVTQSQADAWATELFLLCNESAPGKFHVNGVDHQHWFADFGFTRRNLATSGSATVIHAYAYFTGALQRFGYSGNGTLHLVEYMTEFAYAYHNQLSRRVWVEEVGASAEWMPESYLTEFADKTVRNAVSTGKLWGITWWCSHDLDPRIKGFGNLEYTLGLLDQNNRPKPLGKKFAALAAELRNISVSGTDRKVALVVPERGLSQKPYPPDWTYGDRYMKLISQGKRPAIVLESKAQDEAYLRARGIRDLVRLADVAV